MFGKYLLIQKLLRNSFCKHKRSHFNFWYHYTEAQFHDIAENKHFVTTALI